MSRTATLTIVGTVQIAESYEGFSKDELETELAIALDELGITDKFDTDGLIATLTVHDVSMDEPTDDEQ